MYILCKRTFNLYLGIVASATNWTRPVTLCVTLCVNTNNHMQLLHTHDTFCAHDTCALSCTCLLCTCTPHFLHKVAYTPRFLWLVNNHMQLHTHDTFRAHDICALSRTCLLSCTCTPYFLYTKCMHTHQDSYDLWWYRTIYCTVTMVVLCQC